MSDFVRVKQNDTGHEMSVPVDHYKSNTDAYTKVDKPAADLGGAPYPVKFKTTAASAAAKKTPSGQKADPQKENS